MDSSQLKMSCHPSITSVKGDYAVEWTPYDPKEVRGAQSRVSAEILSARSSILRVISAYKLV
jgi:hypothetical protein